LFFGIFLISGAQEPYSLKFRTSVRDKDGSLLLNKQISLGIGILEGSTTGNLVYSEKHSIVSDTSGLISLTIGEGEEKTGDINSIDWGSDSYFLRVSTDTNRDKVFTEILIMQILVVNVPSGEEDVSISPPEIIEDELVVTRKFVGSYIDFRHTGSDEYSAPNLIWIKTSHEGIYGKFSAYGKKCDFKPGENLYMKRTFYTPGQGAGFWIYRIENDSSVEYRLSDFQHDKKVLVQSWF
jgi:hypothetical protein